MITLKAILHFHHYHNSVMSDTENSNTDLSADCCFLIESPYRILRVGFQIYKNSGRNR